MTRANRAQPNVAERSAFPAGPLLDWYDHHHRDLPWRTSPAQAKRGARPDPYHVWLSEVMLQQTTVKAVLPYFRTFLERWPDIVSLARADTDDVMKAWAGLGYYSRARNLKKCAETVAEAHGGHFPDTEAELRALPGVGAYTAAAIAAIAFDRCAAVIDGNIERVIARFFAVETPLPEAKAELRGLVEKITPHIRPGDFAQALMDLGATTCTPRRPACVLCPIRDGCAALALGDPQHLPLKAPRADKPLRVGAAFIAVRHDGAVLLRKRPDNGLLGGMSEMPTTDWSARRDGRTDIGAGPFEADWARCGSISHVFTHFRLELAVYRAEVASGHTPDGHWWSTPEDVAGEALPSVMKKAIEAALPGIIRKTSRNTPEFS